MKTQLLSVAVQGTAAAQDTSMLKNSGFAIANRAKHSLKGLLGHFTLTICLLLSLNSRGISQNNGTLDIASVGFSVSGPSQVLSLGESVTLTVEIGDASSTVSQATDFELDLELSEDVLFPSQPDIEFTDSWFFDSATVDTTVSLSSSDRIISIDGHRNSSVNGYGQFLEITLVAGKDGVNPMSMIQSGTGIILIEDIGFKQTPLAPDTELTATALLWPNPCRDRLNFNWNGQEPQKVRFFDSRGQLVQNLSPSDIQRASYSTTNLKKGMYRIVLNYPDQKPTSKTVLVE